MSKTACQAHLHSAGEVPILQNFLPSLSDLLRVKERCTRDMDSAGRDYSLHFEGLNAGDPAVRERFRSICLDQLELTDQQALDILTARATSILCTDLTPETLHTVTRRLQEIGITVNIAEPSDHEEMFIPSGSFSIDSDAAFQESQLFERLVQVERRERMYDDYASGYVEEFFAHDTHFGLHSIEDGEQRARNRHAQFLSRQRSLSMPERCGLVFVICALGALLYLFSTRANSAADLVGAIPSPQSAPAVAPAAPGFVGAHSGTSFEGSSSSDSYTVSFRWNLMGSTSSARMLLENTQKAREGSNAANTPIVSRVESDLNFLERNPNGSWRGEAPVYISFAPSHQRVTGLASFTVGASNDSAATTAVVTITYPRNGAEAEPGTTPVSLQETITLTAVASESPSRK